ncbi:lipopolysaccharide biosynthesis protein [uncultured Bacteroides sp.]|uniref:lipopolysaccharide biosynthesis protein n=1 Tax=uncultured Bacteroides sp. TaxID=162156 RepID=UPI002629B872|nr:lipopolysaccharide biosynthesis protein [uncultured Bacteroides sp.]
MGASLKEKTAKGLLWGGIGNGAMQLLNLVFGIFLARLLDSTDYGMVAVLTIFSAMAGVFSESGFILAIVNKKAVKHEDYNAVFWFSIGVGTSLYLLLSACAPLIADFYDTPELTRLARFQFLGFLIGSFGTAHTAYFFRNLMVKERSQIQIVAILVSGIAGVACAYHGWRYWGIALQTILYISANVILLWIRSPWHPTLSFDMRPLRALLPFSSKLLLTSLFTHFNNNIFSALLGRLYTIEQTGYYSQGSKWTTMGYSTISGMINSVGQPIFREVTEDRQRLQNVFRKLMRFTAFVSFPAMLGLGIVSHELIMISVTDKWLDSVPVMQILCVWGAFMPIATLYSNLMNSLGRPNIYMWNTIALGIFQLLCVLCSHPYGLNVMLIVYTTVNMLWLLVWHYFAHKHIGIHLLDTLKDIVPYLFISAAVMAFTYWVAGYIANVYLSLLVKVALAASLYLLLMWGLKSVVFRESLHYLLKRKPYPEDMTAGADGR